MLMSASHISDSESHVVRGYSSVVFCNTTMKKAGSREGNGKHEKMGNIKNGKHHINRRHAPLSLVPHHETLLLLQRRTSKVGITSPMALPTCHNSKSFFRISILYPQRFQTYHLSRALTSTAKNTTRPVTSDRKCENGPSGHDLKSHAVTGSGQPPPNLWLCYATYVDRSQI